MPIWQHITGWWPRRRARKAEKQEADRYELYFYEEQTTEDTLVFVHGLGGHFRDTWANFPALLRTDVDLPRFDILLWGYDASPLPGSAGIDAESKRLMSDLKRHLKQSTSIFLVGHSLGGLTILKGLCTEHLCRRAKDQPAKSVRHIFLYASPVLGAAAATVIEHTVKRLPVLGAIAGQYITELANGNFVNDMIGEINESIYRPEIRRGEERTKRRIPVSAIVANRDQVVQAGSAIGIFLSPQPSYLDADHFDCKTPESHTDRRYTPVAEILSKHYRSWLQKLSARAQKSGRAGEIAAGELLARLRHSLEHALHATRAGRDPKLTKEAREKLLHELLLQVIRSARLHPRKPISEVFRFARDEFVLTHP